MLLRNAALSLSRSIIITFYKNISHSSGCSFSFFHVVVVVVASHRYINYYKTKNHFTRIAQSCAFPAPSGAVAVKEPKQPRDIAVLLVHVNDPMFHLPSSPCPRCCPSYSSCSCSPYCRPCSCYRPLCVLPSFLSSFKGDLFRLCLCCSRCSRRPSPT